MVFFMQREREGIKVAHSYNAIIVGLAQGYASDRYLSYQRRQQSTRNPPPLNFINQSLSMSLSLSLSNKSQGGRERERALYSGRKMLHQQKQEPPTTITGIAMCPNHWLHFMCFCVPFPFVIHELGRSRHVLAFWTFIGASFIIIRDKRDYRSIFVYVLL